VLTVWLCAPLIAPPIAQPKLEVRLNVTDLTPPERVPLGGYTARHGKLEDPGGDPLFARTIDLRQGSTEVAIVSLEMLTVPQSLVREVAKRLPPTVHLFLTATHTHSAPDSQMLNDRMTLFIPGIASYNPKWLTWYADRIAGGVQAARDAKPEPSAPWNYLYWQAGANRGRRKEARPNQTFTETYIGNRPFLAHFAAHATFYDETENQARGDWPGVIDKVGYFAVLLGAIGDVSPKAPGLDKSPPKDRIRGFWQTILGKRPNGTLFPVLGWAGHTASQLGWATAPISLPEPKPSPAFISSYKVGEALSKSLVATFAPRNAEISAWSVGKLAFVGIPGEPTAELGRAIEARGRALGWSRVLVVSHVDGWIGYILAPEDYDRGGYEATLSFYGREESAPIVEAAATALKNLRPH
jgi:hypothetical protein